MLYNLAFVSILDLLKSMFRLRILHSLFFFFLFVSRLALGVA